MFASKSPRLSDDPTSLEAKRYSLLIIEDALLHSMIIGRMAAKASYDFEIACGYEEACEKLKTRTFDCITLDLGLGAHVGADVLKQLAEAHVKASIVLISGSEKSVFEETVRFARSIDLNIHETIPKPIDLTKHRLTLDKLRLRSDLHSVG